MTPPRDDRPIDIPDAPDSDVPTGTVSDRLDVDPERERNRTDPEQTDTQDHPA